MPRLMRYRGLIAVTRNHGVRALSIVYGNVLFVAQLIKNIGYAAIIREGRAIPLMDNSERYMTFARSFISILSIVAKVTNSRYYTFLGEFRYNPEKKVLIYEPYVELLKKVTIKLSQKAVTVRAGEILKRYKRSKSGCTPYTLISLFDNVITLMQNV